MNKTTIGELTTETKVYDAEQIDGFATEVSNNVAQVKDEISDIHDAMQILSKRDLSNLEINDYYISSGGGNVQHAVYHSTGKIYNTGRPIIYTNLVGIGNTMCAIAVFDRDGKYVKSKSMYTDGIAGGGVRFLASGTYEFDEDVGYVILGVQDGVTSTSVEYYESVPLNEYVDSLNTQMSGLSSDIDGMDERLGKNINDVLTISSHMKVVRPITYNMVEFQRGYINTSGNLVEHSAIITSENIYNHGQDLEYTWAYCANKYSYYIAAYDANGIFLKTRSCIVNDPEQTSGVGVRTSGTYHFEDDVAYVRISFSSQYAAGNALRCVNDVYVDVAYGKDIPEIVQTESSHFQQLQDAIEHGVTNHWNGKKWVAYGTSITYGEHGLYPGYLAEKYGLALTNRGIAGGTISEVSAQTTIQAGHAEILKRIVNDANDGLLDDADIVTIEGFVNDWNYGRPLGDVDEAIPVDPLNNLPTTLCGGLRTAIHAILTHSPATVVILTDNNGTADSYPTTKKNGAGMYQREFNDKILEVARFMGVHAIDVGGKSQINEYHPEYLSGSVHHTQLGAQQYAETLWEELRQIHCNTDVVVS